MINTRQTIDDTPQSERLKEIEAIGLRLELNEAKIKAAKRAAEQQTQKRRLKEITDEFGTAEDQYPVMDNFI